MLLGAFVLFFPLLFLQDVSFGAIAASAPGRDGKKCIDKVRTRLKAGGATRF